MHIPSERVYNIMHAEDASIWYVPANDGEQTAFLIKAPTPALKALTAGCPIQLLFGKKDTYMCTGARIGDMPDTPLLLMRVQIVPEEHKALLQSIRQKRFPVFLFNEMDICIAESSIDISSEDAAALLALIGDENKLYSGNFNSDVLHALDCFTYSADKTKLYPNAHEIPIIEITPKIGKWRTVDVYFYNGNAHYKMNIAEKNEGENFENTIWGALESVFPLTLYKSPQVRHGNKLREFTDVFAYHKYGSFLIEAKDLSVVGAGFNKGEEKRLAGIQKQVEKGIKQLVGAVNAFKRGDGLFDAKGNEIHVNRNTVAHCIVLVTELMTCGNWDNIEKQLEDAAKQTNTFFHLLDFREFIILLKECSGDPGLIDYNLMNRFKIFMDEKSVFIRAI